MLDPHPVPSPIAAGNDVNKIMEHKELKGAYSKYHRVKSLNVKAHTDKTQALTPTQKASHLRFAREPRLMAG